MSDTAAPLAQPDPRDHSGRVARNILSVAASQLATWASHGGPMMSPAA